MYNLDSIKIKVSVSKKTIYSFSPQGPILKRSRGGGLPIEIKTKKQPWTFIPYNNPITKISEQMFEISAKQKALFV